MSKNTKAPWDLIIIGAGAAGMMAGIIAGRSKKKVLILEQLDKPGKKLLATGNGKCNFTNSYMTRECFRGDMELVDSVLASFTKEDCLEFFHSIGIYPRERNGYYYPNSEQASSIVTALTEELKRLDVTICCQTKVNGIQKKHKTFELSTNNGTYYGATLLIATGLLAAPKLGGDGSLFSEIKALGHHFSPIVPALCGFYCTGMPFKKVSGVRATGTVTAYINQKEIAQDTGEIQLADYGISGIPVFQISRFLSLGLYEKANVSVAIDLFPQLTEEELLKELMLRFERKNHTKESLLNGLLNQKLVIALLEMLSWNPSSSAKELSKEQLLELTRLMKRINITVNKPRDFEFAQICAGGIPAKEIDIKTLESQYVDGLYFAGELLNVDGICGGYNLHFAWGSGLVAANNICS